MHSHERAAPLVRSISVLDAMLQQDIELGEHLGLCLEPRAPAENNMISQNMQVSRTRK
jgi:hypothetical protein